MSKSRIPIDIALQGGGAHGAFTWGVLTRLVEHKRFKIEGISGTSAGGMNAVALAQGLAEGSPDRVGELLETFWQRVAEVAAFSPIQRGPIDRMLGRWSMDFSFGYVAAQQWQSMLSPYQWNPLNLNPLRKIVEKTFDFELINSDAAPNIFQSATNVRTGRRRIFRKGEISVYTTLASACLPSLYHAVEVDGEHYWDGGYMGNPPLLPLLNESDARDILLVQINPFVREDLPGNAAEISNRINEITFNASLIHELRTVGLLKQVIDAEGLERPAYVDGRLHAIPAAEEMLKLNVSSKMNPEPKFLRHLHDLGRQSAEEWLAEHGKDVGVRSSWVPREVLEDIRTPAHLSSDYVPRTRIADAPHQHSAQEEKPAKAAE
ncbi:MAG: patatin-like phospholipase family protein [Pseudomonadota bacterium]